MDLMHPRRIRYDAVSSAKVQLVVHPGDVLIVSDDVAAQLLQASAQFKDADAPPPVRPEPEPEPEVAVSKPAAKPKSAAKRTARKS